MTVITTKTEYLPFEEHSKEVQEKILEKHYSVNVDHEWYESTLENLTEALQKAGFNDINIYFSGFSRQGDGAQFNGYYIFEGKKLAKIKKEYPKWIELHDFVRGLENIASKYSDIYFKISHKGHYSHENCTEFYFERNDYKEVKSEHEETIIHHCKSFMKEIYSLLEDEYDYLTSEEAIKETFDCNDYEFDAAGNML